MAERELHAATPWLEGRALHTGRRSRVRVLPAPARSGLRFLRVDLRPPCEIPASLETAVPSRRRTRLARGGVEIATVEHVLSALAGLGIWDARIELDGEEPPALDGSALPFAGALVAASRPCACVRARLRVTRALSLRRGTAACQLLPAESTLLVCRIAFADSAIGRQQLRLPLEAEAYLARLAPARSFGLLEEASALRGAGLARGADLSNTLVLARGRVLNPGGTRFHDEPVRHKLLDAIGDLALLGAPLAGELRLERCSHALLLAMLARARDEGVLEKEA
jgi:UDP-3-O-[3-hydroxymyristoyl] N-acetylglucosamine deacetylase